MAGEVAQWVVVTATHSDHKSLIAGTTWREERIDFCKLFSDMGYTHLTHIKTQNKVY